MSGPSMSIKFEGKPPFYLGIAEVASAHALDGNVVLRATISVPELRPKSVSVQFLVAIKEGLEDPGRMLLGI